MVLRNLKGYVLVNVRFSLNGEIDNEKSKVFLDNSKAMNYLYETIQKDHANMYIDPIVPPYELKEIEIVT